MVRTSMRLFLGGLVWGLIAAGAGAQPLQQDPGPDGIVCVEAENYDLYTERTNTWILIEEVANGFAPPDGFSAGFALQSTPTTLATGGGGSPATSKRGARSLIMPSISSRRGLTTSGFSPMAWTVTRIRSTLAWTARSLRPRL